MLSPTKTNVPGSPGNFQKVESKPRIFWIWKVCDNTKELQRGQWQKFFARIMKSAEVLAANHRLELSANLKPLLLTGNLPVIQSAQKSFILCQESEAETSCWTFNQIKSLFSLGLGRWFFYLILTLFFRCGLTWLVYNSFFTEAIRTKKREKS